MAVDKLVDSTQLDADLTSVANAIRAKSGGNSQLAFPSGFVSEIGNIPTGGGDATGDQYVDRYLSTARMDVYDSFSADALKPTNANVMFSARAETLCFWNMTGASNQYSAQNCLGIYAKTLVMPKVTRLCADFIKSTGSLEKLDVAPTRFDTNAIRNATNLVTIIIRSTSIPTLGNSSVLSETPFKSGGTGGTIYIPKTLYDHLGDNSSSDYKAASNWSVIDGYGTITWAKIEGSQYDGYYADGTAIPAS